MACQCFAKSESSCTRPYPPGRSLDDPSAFLTPLLGFEPPSRAEDPPHRSQAESQKAEDRAKAGADVDVGNAVKAPAKTAYQIDYGIEQSDFLPERRQHADRIEGAAQEGEWSDDHERNHLQFLPVVRPQPDNESEHAEAHRSEQ